MKLRIYLSIILWFIKLTAAYAEVVSVDSAYVYGIPVTTDTANVYLVLKHHLSTNCWYVGSTVSVSQNSIVGQLCYNVGVNTEVCRHVDTVSLGAFSTGTYNITGVVAVPEYSNCDTIYASDTAKVSYTIVSTGISEVVSNRITLTPNPTANKLICTLSASPKQAYYQVLSTDGEVLINNTTITQPHFVVDVSQLASGSYYLVLQDEKARTIKRFVKY